MKFITWAYDMGFLRKSMPFQPTVRQMVTCHFTANGCCETFPVCCETFPDCCETFPVCCENFPVCCENFPDYCETFSDCCESFPECCETFLVSKNPICFEMTEHLKNTINANVCKAVTSFNVGPLIWA